MLTEPFGQQLLIFRSPLMTVNDLNNPMLAVSPLVGFDYIITDPRTGDNNLLYTEDLSGPSWIRENISVIENAGDVNGPYGNNAFLVTVTDAGPKLAQQVAVEPNSQYTVSWYIRGTDNPGAVWFNIVDQGDMNPLVDPFEYAAPDNDWFTRQSITFTTRENTRLVEVRFIDLNSSIGSIIISAPQVDPGDQLAPYTPTESSAYVSRLNEDIITINALQQTKPSITVGLRVDMKTYRSSDNVELNIISDIFAGYGGNVNFIWFDNADLAGDVTRQLQVDAAVTARAANYSVAFSCWDPLDIFGTNQSFALNLTGESLPLFPGDMFINLYWMYGGDCQPYTEHISREILLTSYATDLNIDLMTFLTARGPDSYTEDLGFNARQWYQDVANFWGYTAIGYGVDRSNYAEGDMLVCFYSYLLLNPSIPPAMLKYWLQTNNSVRRSDPSGTTITNGSLNATIGSSTTTFTAPAGYTNPVGAAVTPREELCLP